MGVACGRIGVVGDVVDVWVNNMVGVGMVGRGGERCVAQAELPVERGHGVGGGGHGGRGRGGLRRGCHPEGGRHGARRAGRCHHRDQGAVPLKRYREQHYPRRCQEKHPGTSLHSTNLIPAPAQIHTTTHFPLEHKIHSPNLVNTRF